MRAHDRGFSLLEMIIAIGVMLTVTAGVFGVVHPAHGAYAAEPEIADLQQRLRVAADALSKDLLVAGAGASLGPLAGPLARYLPPVLPFRQGATNDDPPGTFAADRITLLSVPSTTAETTLTADLTPSSLTMQVSAEANCPPGQNLCGFAKDLPVLVYDEQGSFNVFTVTAVADALLQIAVSKPADAAETTYASGAKVVEVVSHTYALKTDAATGALQLTLYDGTHNADVPVLDHIVGLTFAYDGEPAPPALTKLPSEPSGPWTTYGPRPPAAGAKPTDYPAGENCAFTVDGGGYSVSRLASFGAGTTLVRLTPTQLTDGPWCPDALNANRWDADLLRVRKVTVTLRVETASAALRGPAGVLFTNGGTSTGGGRWVPDQQVRFEIAPRNLNVWR